MPFPVTQMGLMMTATRMRTVEIVSSIWKIPLIVFRHRLVGECVFTKDVITTGNIVVWRKTVVPIVPDEHSVFTPGSGPPVM